MTIETARMILRQATLADADTLLTYRARNAEHFARFLPQMPADLGAQHAWIAAHSPPSGGCGAPFALLALEKTTNVLVALVDACEFSREHPIGTTLNYMVDGEYQGRGFASEAFAAALQYAFDNLGLEAAWAYFHPDNVRSERLLIRNGFTILAPPPTTAELAGLLRPSVVALRLRDAARQP